MRSSARFTARLERLHEPQSADAEGAPARTRFAETPSDLRASSGEGHAERGEAFSPGLVSIETSGKTLAPSRFGDPRSRRISRMRRKVMAAGDSHKENALRENLEPWFLTLTYAPENRWHPRHVSEFLHELRRWHGDRMRYVWVAELQEKRMARSGESSAHCMHYHIVLWLPRHRRPPKPDKSGMWRHGMSQVERAFQPVGYLLKYASKGGDGAELPRGARLCGAGGLERAGRLSVRWWLLPRYIRDQCIAADDVHRCRGGGWVSMSSGQWWPPWEATPVQNHLPDGQQ